MQVHVKQLHGGTLGAWQQPQCLRPSSANCNTGVAWYHFWQALHHCLQAIDLINKSNMKVKEAKHITVLQQHIAAFLHVQQPTMHHKLSSLFYGGFNVCYMS